MTETIEQESKRGRVRRLLIEPLEAWGMCRPPVRLNGKTRNEAQTLADTKHKAFIARICDELAHMTDNELFAMQRWFQVQGQGKDRRHWPEFVSIAGAAHGYRPVPVADIPEVASWFKSRKGIELSHSSALLVAHLRFITKFRHTPVKPEDVAKVDRKAADLAAQWKLCMELRD